MQGNQEKSPDFFHSSISQNTDEGTHSEFFNRTTNNHPKNEWRIIGRADFSWRRDLSRNGQQLWLWLIRDLGDKDVLCEVAKLQEWDLEMALEELRTYEILDERDPNRVRIVSK